jgi:primary-amine oxidase
LNYLDGSGPAPARYAKVPFYENYITAAAAKNNTGPPTYSSILVGPLPVSNATTWERLTNIYTSLNGTTRIIYGDMDYRAYSKFNKKITDDIKDITKDMWANETKHTSYSGQDPYWQYDNKITEWSQYWGYATGDFDSSDLLPLGLYYGASYDILGNQPHTWSFIGYLYNDILYKTAEEFRAAYFSPGFEKLEPNIDGLWTHTDQRGPGFPADKAAPPPMPVAESARFSVDYRQKYVEWMGFSFYLTFLDDSGLTMYDIRFKGERILYELGIQEAMAHYAGNDPVQSGTSYLDGAYGLGLANELMPGYDCPTYASYLNITVESESSYEASRDINAVCLFEFDADYSIQRHSYQSNTKNIYFVVRTITTVGNYDYSFSYEFYMDGSIQVVVRAAGYIQSAYWAKNADYGYHIHDSLSGSMHDHVLNFKADFDILGTANTMELVTFTPVTESYVWSDQPRNTMKLVRSEIASEDESRLFWAQNGQTQYRIVNKDKPNKYGEYRGYRILPSQGAIHLSVNNSSNLVNAANWAYHDLQITKQKDTEPRSANTMNGENVYDPLVNFDRFFDGESLEQEDLVLWFNLGMHHLPHTGDLPNTVFTTAHSAIQISPSNYFTHDQSRDTVNMVRLDYISKKKGTEVLTFGQADQICMANLSSVYY